MGGFLIGSAAVMLSPKNKTADCSFKTLPLSSTLVLLGGGGVYKPTNSVQMMDIPTESSSIPQWRQGPPMNRPRRDFDAVVCNGAVYAIGGGTHVIEYINIHDLWKQPERGKATQSWCDLSCKLSSCPSRAGSTAVVKDRYIVIVTYASRGGKVRILDTHDRDNHTLSTIDAPSRGLVRRKGFTTVAVENKMYIVGGKRMAGYEDVKAVECIEFSWNDSANDQNELVSPGTESSCFEFRPNVLSWKVETDLCLLHARYKHSSVVVGSKIVVAGGSSCEETDYESVEVIDVECREMSELPELNEANIGDQFLLALPDLGSLLAVDRTSGTVESLQFGDDLGKLETRRRTIRKVRRPANEIGFLDMVWVEEYLSHVAKCLSFENMQVLSTKEDFIRN